MSNIGIENKITVVIKLIIKTLKVNILIGEPNSLKEITITLGINKVNSIKINVATRIGLDRSTNKRIRVNTTKKIMIFVIKQLINRC